LMLSGQPGCPNRVFNAGGIQTMMDDYAQHHQGLAPIVIAADQLGADSHNTLCVDSQVYGNALTYLTQDVVDWVKDNLPAAQDAKDWAIAGFSQGATCSMQIGPNYPNLFGTIIPTGSEIGPSNGSEQEMIDRFFDGDREAYERQIPINAIRNHAPSDQTLIMGTGEKDVESLHNIEEIAPVARKAGMHVTAVESLGNAHDWHAVQDTLRYGLAVFGYDTGMSSVKPKLSDYTNLRRIKIS
ncbi:alpha/beta hydrolase, partial [Bifidobacterium dentium]